MDTNVYVKVELLAVVSRDEMADILQDEQFLTESVRELQEDSLCDLLPYADILDTNVSVEGL